MLDERTYEFERIKLQMESEINSLQNDKKRI